MKLTSKSMVSHLKSIRLQRQDKDWSRISLANTCLKEANLATMPQMHSTDLPNFIAKFVQENVKVND